MLKDEMCLCGKWIRIARNRIHREGRSRIHIEFGIGFGRVVEYIPHL